MRGTYEPIPPHFSRDLSSLLTMMIKVDPSQRLDTQQLVSIPFMQEHIVEAQMSMGRVDPYVPPGEVTSSTLHAKSSTRKSNSSSSTATGSSGPAPVVPNPLVNTKA